MTSWHEFHQYELENGGMDDHDDGDTDEVCHCGLPIEDHKLGGAAEHDYVPKSERVFTHCNVCGRKLHDPEENAVGMCAICANL